MVHIKKKKKKTKKDDKAALGTAADRTIQGWRYREKSPNEAGVRGNGGSLTKHGLSGRSDQARATLPAE